MMLITLLIQYDDIKPSGIETLGNEREGREEGSESISGKTTEGNLREEESKAKVALH